MSIQSDVSITLSVKDLVAPTSLTGNSLAIYIADQIGIIYKLDSSNGKISIFLDIREYIPTLNERYDERGLLGLALHPQFITNGKFYIFYSTDRYDSHQLNIKYHNVLSEFTYKNGIVSLTSEKVLLMIPRDLNFHNGGKIDFGPDGYLYVALGDGGPQEDANNNAQNLNSLLGKILRININGTPANDNPFIGMENVKPEIWAYGFRNPWGIDFYKGWLLVSDAGYESGTGQEEINLIVKGGNYGWNIKEGVYIAPWIKNFDIPTHLIDPIFAYTTSDPNFADDTVSTIVGGHVNNKGEYICADYSGRLIRLRLNHVNYDDVSMELIDTYSLGKKIRSFGKRYVEMNDGSINTEIYVLTSDLSGPTGTTGEVYLLSFD